MAGFIVSKFEWAGEVLRLKRKYHNLAAFVLVDSLVALTVVMMVLGWLALCESQLKLQREKMGRTLRIARLAKETSDVLLIKKGRRVSCSDGPYRAVADSHRVAVMCGRQLVWETKG